MAQKFKGTPPDGERWEKVDSVTDEDGRVFDIYVQERDESQGPDWVTVKVAADGAVEGKANYWFTINTETGAIGFIRDLAAMKNKRPALHAEVEQSLGIGYDEQRRQKQRMRAWG